MSRWTRRAQRPPAGIAAPASADSVQSHREDSSAPVTLGDGPDEETDSSASVGSLVSAAVVVLLLVGAIVMAFDFNAAARQLPLLVGIPTLLLGLAVLIREIVRLRRARRDRPRPTSSVTATDDTGADPAKTAGMSEAKVFIVFAALVVAYLLLGFPWGGALFLFFFLFLVAKIHIVKSLLITVGVIAPFYFVFVVLLNIPNFSGLLLP